MVMIFFDTTSKAQSMQEIIDKVDFLKITNLLCKRQCEENEWQATDWQKTQPVLHSHSFCTLRSQPTWIFEKKSPENFKKANLNLPQLGNNLHNIYIVLYNYSHSFYIVLGTISNPRWFKVYREDMPWLHANTVPFYISDLSTLTFGILGQGRVLEPSHCICEWEDCICKRYTW